MIHFKFSEKDQRYLFMTIDNDEDKKIMAELEHWMNLTDPICFLPTYTGPRFTQDFLFTYVQQSGKKVWWCSKGLWQDIYKFFRDNNVQYDGLDPTKFKRELTHSFEHFKQVVQSWGLKYEPRPYQYEAAYNVLQWKSSISSLPTRSGKTLMAYMIFRYAMEYLGVKKILMIVPSIDLVKQGYDDFNEYAEFFKSECVWGGGKLVESANITIGTFQSLIKFIDKKDKKYNPHFFDGYDCVFVDETHRATAANIKNIISQPFMLNVKIAFGMTGTVPKEHTIEHYCLHSLLGAKIQHIEPRELMDAGYISDIDIHQCRLYYDDEEKQKDIFIRCAEYSLKDFVYVPNKNGKKTTVALPNPEFLIRNEKQDLPYGIREAKYAIYKHKNLYSDTEYVNLLGETIKGSTKSNMLHIEQMMIHFFPERTEYICNKILPQCKYNTLILCQYTSYAEHLYETIKEQFPHKQVLMIIGKVTPKKRNEIKALLKEYNNCILVANYSILSTGITLGNLCYGILAESYKSEVLNMQSLGRGLGLSDLKEKYIVYDIIDTFSDKITNHSIYRQGLSKIKMYKEKQYPFVIETEHIGKKTVLPIKEEPKKKTTKKLTTKEVVESLF